MAINIKNDCSNIKWNEVRDILKEVGMAYFDDEGIHKKAFENSYAKVFVFDGDKMIGFGRAISDGVYQAAIYDVAVLPAYQGRKIGSAIIDNIVEQIPNCNFILYAKPGKEGFYEKQDFKQMKTAMGLFNDPQKMKTKGFII